MKFSPKSLLIGALLFWNAPATFSQITMTGGQTAQQLAEFLAGPNITVTNAVLSQGNTVLPALTSSPAAGTFAGVNSDIGFDSVCNLLPKVIQGRRSLYAPHPNNLDF